MITKQHIIDEIIRTSNKETGKALGKQAFETNTGIKTSDWYGKYWVRWSDAVKEAGFEPNQYNTAYKEDFILEKYAQLIRELKRIPVTGELRMKSINDSSFPSHSVFSRKWSKNQLIENVIKFCRMNDGWNDVLEICNNYKPKQEVQVQFDDEPNSKNDGYVYLVKSGKYYKIGMTNDILRREREIKLELPERAETIHVIRTDDPSGIEAYWHKRFSKKQTNGEWFTLTTSDVKAFRKRKFM